MGGSEFFQNLIKRGRGFYTGMGVGRFGNFPKTILIQVVKIIGNLNFKINQQNIIIEPLVSLLIFQIQKSFLFN